MNRVVVIILGLMIITGIIGYVMVYQNTSKSLTSVQTVSSISFQQDLRLLPDVYPLYDKLTWGDAYATSSFGIVGNEVASESILDTSDLASLFLPFEQYYKDKLTRSGWSEDMSFAADGPGSSMSGYTKDGATIILSYHSIFKDRPQNEPAQCPCDISFKIFSSAKNK